MSSDFDPEIDDTAVSAIEGVVDNNGVLRLQAPSISSYNFDGFIPAEQFNYSASAIIPGMKISFTGSAENQQYYSILYVDDTDEIFSASPSSIITIQYLDEDYLVQEIAIAASAIMPVVIENWNNKYIGQEGWHITNSGNAIFSNVAVRGEIEATTLDVGGADGITYDGNTVTIGASVIINAPLTVGASGNFIVSGSAAQDIISNNTTITGGNIATGKIKSTGYSGPGTGSAFSTAGMLINLDDGGISSKNFRIDSNGNAFLQGSINATSGSFSGALNAATGTFSGNLSAAGGTFAGSLSAATGTFSGNLSAAGGTFSGTVSANNVTAGTLTGSTFRSSAGITATSGNGVYLDASGNVRFATTSASLQFNSGGLTVGGGTISGAVINGGSINGGSITGGTISGQSGNIGGFTLGSNSFTAGTNPNVVGILTGGTNAFFAGASDTAGTGAKFLVTNAGALTATNANITGAINATSGTFAGNLSAAGGTFAGNLSAAGGTFAGTLSANSITSGTLNASNVSIINLNADNITSGTLTGRTIKSAASGQRVEITANQIGFYDTGGIGSGGAYGSNQGILVGGGNSVILWGTRIDFYNGFFGPYVSVVNGKFTGDGGGLTSVPGSSITGNITTNSKNITDYTINQNLGLGNNVTFNTITTSTAGSSIKPTVFGNAQTQFQIRYSSGTGDNIVGVFTSTINIKENIIPLIGQQSSIVPEEKSGGSPEKLDFNPDNIFNITPVQYTVINDESQEKQVGFIVEDLLNHWPQAVTYDYDTKKPFSYNTNSIVAGLVYAVKKQKEIIENLENRMLQLESKLGVIDGS